MKRLVTCSIIFILLLTLFVVPISNAATISVAGRTMSVHLVQKDCETVELTWTRAKYYRKTIKLADKKSYYWYSYDVSVNGRTYRTNTNAIRLSTSQLKQGNKIVVYSTHTKSNNSKGNDAIPIEESYSLTVPKLYGHSYVYKYKKVNANYHTETIQCKKCKKIKSAKNSLHSFVRTGILTKKCSKCGYIKKGLI